MLDTQVRKVSIDHPQSPCLPLPLLATLLPTLPLTPQTREFPGFFCDKFCCDGLSPRGFHPNEPSNVEDSLGAFGTSLGPPCFTVSELDASLESVRSL